jgi:hypothetical protein
MENKIIYNVFSDEEIKDIYLAIDFKKDEIQNQTFLGRTRLDYETDDLYLLPKNIIQKAYDLINQFSDKDNRNYEFRYFMFVEYNNKFGIPSLGPHKDTTPFTGSLLCQIESNKSWDLYVDGNPYTLIDNSALLLNVRDQDHWRMPEEFKDGEYIKMLFLHYIDLNDIRENKATPEQLHEINTKWAHITGYTPEQKTYEI